VVKVVAAAIATVVSVALATAVSLVAMIEIVAWEATVAAVRRMFQIELLELHHLAILIVITSRRITFRADVVQLIQTEHIPSPWKSSLCPEARRGKEVVALVARKVREARAN